MKQVKPKDDAFYEPIIAWGIIEIKSPDNPKKKEYMVVSLSPTTMRGLQKFISVVPAAPGTIGAWKKLDPKDDFSVLVAVSIDGGETFFNMGGQCECEHHDDVKSATEHVSRSRDPMVG